MKKILFFLIIILVALTSINMVSAVLDCLPLEFQAGQVYTNCYEIKTKQFNTTRPKINVSFQESVQVQHIRLSRIGGIGLGLLELEPEELFQEFENYGDYYELMQDANGLYQPVNILSDGTYVFRIRGFNEPNIHINALVFFEINASQMSMWVKSPAHHDIPKPLFGASSERINNFTIETERPVMGCKYAFGIPQMSAEVLYEDFLVREFERENPTTLTIPDFDFNDPFSFTVPNSTHNFRRIDVVCREQTPQDVPARYSYQRLYFVYIGTNPQIQLIQANPETVINYEEPFSQVTITTDQTTKCITEIEPLPSGTLGRNPFFEYTNTYLFDKLEYYKTETQDLFSFALEPSPYEFSLNITCTNLAGLSSSATKIIGTDFQQTANFQFITPGNYVNTNNINVSGSYVLQGVNCRARFNDEQTTYPLTYRQQLPNGRYLYQNIITKNLQEGTNTVHVSCDGMSPGAYDSRTFTVDRIPPTNTQIQTKASTCTLSQITATLSAEDENGIARYEYRLEYRGNKPINFQTQLGNTTSSSLTLTIPASIRPQIENETLRLNVRAFDVAGNAGQWVFRDIKMSSPNAIECDFTPPTIRIQTNYNEDLHNWRINVTCTDGQSGCRQSFNWGTITNTSQQCRTTHTHSLGNLITVNQKGLFCATVYDLNNNNATKTITLKEEDSDTDDDDDDDDEFEWEEGCEGICGGDCPPCPEGIGPCENDSDCKTGYCEDGICTAPSCEGICGGPYCPPCEEGEGPCEDDSECDTNYCVDGICEVASCEDGIKNGLETGIDCGGPHCPPCEVGEECLNDADCEDGNCDDGFCELPSCFNGKQDGQETGEDCGGPDCDPCPLGGGCEIDLDCAEGKCIEGICALPDTTTPWGPDGPDWDDDDPTRPDDDDPTRPSFDEDKKASTLGIIFLILGFLMMIAGGVLLYLEDEKRKKQKQTDELNKTKTALGAGIPRVSNINDKGGIQTKQLSPQEIAMKKKAWEESQKIKDEKRKEVLGTFKDEKEDEKPINAEQKPEQRTGQSPEQKPGQKPVQPGTKTKTVTKEDAKKDEFIDIHKLNKEEDSFEKLKEKVKKHEETKNKTKNKTPTNKEQQKKQDEDFFNKLKEMNEKKQPTKKTAKKTTKK